MALASFLDIHSERPSFFLSLRNYETKDIHPAILLCLHCPTLVFMLFIFEKAMIVSCFLKRDKNLKNSN